MATINIKDPRVHDLATQLAVLKGSSATRAAREAGITIVPVDGEIAAPAQVPGIRFAPVPESRSPRERRLPGMAGMRKAPSPAHQRR